MLNPLKPKPIDISKKIEALKTKGLNFESVVVQESILFVLVTRELHGETREEQPKEVKSVRSEERRVGKECRDCTRTHAFTNKTLPK